MENWKYSNRPHLRDEQFIQTYNQTGCTDVLHLGGCTVICGIHGEIDSNSGYRICGETIFNAGHTEKTLQIGSNSFSCGNSSISIGNGAVALCTNSVTIGCGNTSCSCGANIIGGYNNIIFSGNTNATIVGLNGVEIGANTYCNSVIVPSLAILNTPTGSGKLLCRNSINGAIELTPTPTITVTGVTNLGTGSGAIYTGLSNCNIQLKTLSGGTNINLTCNGNYITINADTSGSVVVTPNDVVYTCKNIPTGLTTATDNILFGCDAGKSITTSSNNIALGYRALYFSNSSDGHNIAIGQCAIGCGLISGYYNIGLGYQALAKTTCGYNNIGLGYLALNSNTSGCYNIANGCQALYYNTTGNNNIAIGFTALFSNTGGTNNVAIGNGSGYNEMGSNKLYVANYPNKSLIYGEFDNEKLCIRGKTYISGLTNASKSNAVFYDNATHELTYATASGGGITGATNLGTGNGTIYTGISNNSIQFKTLSGGTNVTLTCNGSYITINASVSSMPINLASSASYYVKSTFTS